MKLSPQTQPSHLGCQAILAFVLLLIPGIPFLHAFAADATGSKNIDLGKLPPPAKTSTDFQHDIQPLLSDRCLKCHGPEKQKGGLRLDSKAGAFKGGDDGQVIIPGHSAESRLVHLVAGLEKDLIMPPKGEPLNQEQVSLIRAWIDQGANWPETPTAQSTHWSLQPLKASMPSQPNTDVSPIDAFVSARLATNTLTLSPPADRVTLIRRLSFDLIGLPPSPSQIDEFVHNTSPKAYQELVERLLASPQYGERWGRHWLDVARYSESQGFEYDRLRDNAWHYRDYVVKSFNDDKPYDLFMKEQVAGDVIEPVTSEGIIGASLLVCGAWDEAGNNQANATQKAITREEEMEDMISVVGQSFLGLTINCARCHSHKFDPIPQQDYYRIKAVFDGVRSGERSIATPAEIKAHDEQIAALKKQVTSAQERIKSIEGEGRKRAVVKHCPDLTEPAPTPFARWTFETSTKTSFAGELKGGASIEKGRLKLGGSASYFKAGPVASDIHEKSLEAWVTLSDLDQGGGGVISIESEDGKVFDAIVFGERQKKKWMAGSSNFERTRDLDAPEEMSPPGTLVHMVAVYRKDNSIVLFRNGESYGKPYTPASPLQRFNAGSARVLLGMRHTGGTKPFLAGEIKQAALYDRALSAEEVSALFHARGVVIPESEIIDNLTIAEHAEREAALSELKKSQNALDAIKPLPVSYCGTRVQPAPTHKLKRGDVKSPEEIVTPAGLSAIAEVNPEFGLPADSPEAQRRLKFAEWLANPRNPLPARVMANRIWHFHFGQGLVSTPNDFGVSGARPTHPELLDWLAMKFIESGWSIKALHRLIVNSATYQQSSQAYSKGLSLDADDSLLWRFPPRRLEAEAIRDAMLSVSGELNPTMGGPSFRPFDIIKFPANAYVPVDKMGPEFNRRTIYRMNVNSGKEPLLDAFDCPDPSVKTPRRGATITPLQALGLMNSSFVQRQAEHLAQRALKKSGNDLPGAIQTAYRLCLGRLPTSDESKRALAAAHDRSVTNVCWALLNSTEFIYVR